MAPLLLLLVAMAARSMAQQNQTIQNANASVTAAVPSYQNKATRYWYGPNGVIDFFEQVNDARAGAAMNTSLLFPLDGAAVFSLLADPACPFTTNASFYYYNMTAAEAFICCHLTVLNAPGWDDIMAQLQHYFFSPAYVPDGFQGRVVDQLYNVQILRTIEAEVVNTRACKDDLRIHNPESDVLRAELLGQMMGEILRTYNYIGATAISLSTCMNYPALTTGCATSTGPLLGVDIIPNMQFVAYDAFFQSICGAGALTAFNTYILNKVACF